MAARDDILRAVRGHAPPGPELPRAGGPAATYPDLAARLEAAVTEVGGKLIRARDASHADAALRALPIPTDAVVSLVSGVGSSTLDIDAVDDPRALSNLDLVVLRGALAVAENGAVWIEGSSLPHHALAVIPEHLAIVVDAASIVPDLHAAYAALELATRPRWGLFLAGPSKTADIEQSLVIGAHGARSATVFLVG